MGRKKMNLENLISRLQKEDFLSETMSVCQTVGIELAQEAVKIEEMKNRSDRNLKLLSIRTKKVCKYIDIPHFIKYYNGLMVDMGESSKTFGLECSEGTESWTIKDMYDELLAVLRKRLLANNALCLGRENINLYIRSRNFIKDFESLANGYKSVDKHDKPYKINKH